MLKKERKLYGIILCMSIGGVAWGLANFLPFGSLVGGPVFAILLGMLLANFKRPSYLESGIKFSSKKILQYAIILIGFGLNISAILTTGSESFIVMVFTIFTSLIVAFLGGKLLKIPSNSSILIGVGTSICGGSAIAATAPVIDADDKEVAYSISTIFLFNIIAALLFPPIGRLLGMSDIGFGIWAGTAINDTSSVVAAGYSFSTVAGDYATIVKLTRSLMIIPITLILAMWRTSKLTSDHQKGTYNIVKIFPWFIIGFLLTAIINSLGIFPNSLTSGLNNFGRFCIMIAMAGIGLNTNLGSLIRHGKRPILLGLCCWIAVAIVSLIAMNASCLI